MLVARAGTLTTSPRELTSTSASRKRKRRTSSKKLSLADKEVKALESALEWVSARKDLMEVSIAKSILFLACESVELAESAEYYFRSQTDYDIFKYNWGRLKKENKRREYLVDTTFIIPTIEAAIRVIDRGI